jgi:hypothetical protein
MPDDPSKNGREFVSQHGSPETPPPRVHAANDFINRPNDKTARHYDSASEIQGACRRPDPPGDRGDDHNPRDQVGRLRDRDGAGLAIAEKPLQNLARHHFLLPPHDYPRGAITTAMISANMMIGIWRRLREGKYNGASPASAAIGSSKKIAE